MLRVVHYINQFFGGLGGEEHAEHPLEWRTGPVGPGLGLQRLFGARAEVEATVICGDDYFNANQAAVRQQILEIVASRRPHVFVAGPAFGAGRYGVACGQLGKAVATELGIAALTAMHPQNPGVELYRSTRGLYILPTEMLANDMPRVLPRMATLALKLGAGASLGPADEEGYLATGYRPMAVVAESGARRAVNMLVAKLQGLPYQTEIPVQSFEAGPPAPPVPSLSRATIALLTTSGLVPRGNPDGFRMFNADAWAPYSVEGMDALAPGDWQLMHGGFNTAFANANPNLVLPLDVARELEGQAFGRLHPEFVSLTGVGTPIGSAQRMAREIAVYLKQASVDAAILVAT